MSYRSAADYERAYRQKQTTPEQVARRFLAGVKASEEAKLPLRIFISQSADDLMAQAGRSSERWLKGNPLGPLDGVPIAVKDEVHVAGYCTTVGTQFLGKTPQTTDATSVARLREAGALLVGKTNMHEIGMGTTGINPHHGAARNPYDATRMTGGSSSGSAAAVASGLCPIALGADGGGSIRIPASLCGVVGLKPTFGRVSEDGAAPLCWSVAHIGPIASCVRDAALMLEAVAGADPKDANTLAAPALGSFAPRRDLDGLRVGWDPHWWSQADPSVHEVCMVAMSQLISAGASLREVKVDHLQWVRLVEILTIGSEMAASQFEYLKKYRSQYGADTRLLLAMASQTTAVDYLRAQRLRTRIDLAFREALGEVDALITPTTAISAATIRSDALETGESDPQLLDALTAFAFPANLTGLPALSVPAGYDGSGLPIGLQIMTRHWQEWTACDIGAVVEASATFRKPQTLVDLLPDCAPA